MTSKAEPYPYERIDTNKISESIRTAEGEFIICRNPFRWHRDGKVISGGYEMFDMQTVCDDNKWEVVAVFGEHIAVCKETAQS